MKFIYVVVMLALFAGGYFMRDVVEPTKEAQADVAGMNQFDLRHDYDFKKAVRKVVEKYCEVDSRGDIDC